MTDSENDSSTKTERIDTIAQFMEWVNGLEGGLLLYRGLINASYEVNSSADRRIGKKGDLLKYTEDLLRRAKDKHLHQQTGKADFFDLELLAELQHHGAATCLIDFTKDPLIALWFACQEDTDTQNRDRDREDGMVIAMPTKDTSKFRQVKSATSTENIYQFQRVNQTPPTKKTYQFQRVNDNSLEQPIKAFFTGSSDKQAPSSDKQASSSDEDKFLTDSSDKQKSPNLWKWEPWHQNNRILAQKAVFVFGPEDITEADYQSAIIKQNKKQGLLDELKVKHGIDEEYLFSDLTGFAIANAQHKTYAPKRPQDYFDQGLGHHQRGELRKAIEKYNQAIALNDQATPPNPEFAAGAYYNRGNAKSRAGHLEDALQDYSQAIALNDKAIAPNLKLAADAYNNRGLAKSELGKPEDAIPDLDEAIVLNPQLADAYYNRGNAKGKSGQHKDALQDFDQAIALNPQYALAYMNLGIVKQELGMRANPINVESLEDAIQDHNQAIALNPQLAEAYMNRGIVQYLLKRSEDAIQDHNQAIALNPQLAEAYMNRGLVKEQLKKLEDAIQDHNQAIALNQQYAKAYYNRGIAKKKLGNLEGAKEDLEEAHRLDSEFPKPS